MRNPPTSAGDRDPSTYELRCTVVSVEKSNGPKGAAGNDWYRYVIDSPGSPITGYRRGAKRDILEYLEECKSKLEERLNTRKAPRSTGRKPARRAPASN